MVHDISLRSILKKVGFNMLTYNDINDLLTELSMDQNKSIDIDNLTYMNVWDFAKEDDMTYSEDCTEANTDLLSDLFMHFSDTSK